MQGQGFPWFRLYLKNISSDEIFSFLTTNLIWGIVLYLLMAVSRRLVGVVLKCTVVILQSIVITVIFC